MIRPISPGKKAATSLYAAIRHPRQRRHVRRDSVFQVSSARTHSPYRCRRPRRLRLQPSPKGWRRTSRIARRRLCKRRPRQASLAPPYRALRELSRCRRMHGREGLSENLHTARRNVSLAPFNPAASSGRPRACRHDRLPPRERAPIAIEQLASPVFGLTISWILNLPPLHAATVGIGVPLSDDPSRSCCSTAAMTAFQLNLAAAAK